MSRYSRLKNIKPATAIECAQYLQDLQHGTCKPLPLVSERPALVPPFLPPESKGANNRGWCLKNHSPANLTLGLRISSISARHEHQTHQIRQDRQGIYDKKKNKTGNFNIYKIYKTAHASLCRWCRSGRRWFHHSCLRARAQITGVDV